MDTKLIRELIEEAKEARFHIAELAGEYEHKFCGCVYCRLKPAIIAAERALAEVESPTWGSETPQTHYLPNQKEALRLADELSRVVLTNIYGKEDRRILARAYREKRGLKKGKPCES